MDDIAKLWTARPGTPVIPSSFSMIDLLRKRRSIRQYRDNTIEPEKIALLKEAALRAPSSRDIKPWRFVFVTDRALLERLSLAKESGSDFLAGAGLGVVIAADGAKSDVWIEDCSIASIILQLAGLSMGLGSCWIQVRNRMHDSDQPAEDYVKAILGLPEDLRVLSMIAFGYPDEEPEPVPMDALDRHKVTDRDLSAPG